MSQLQPKPTTINGLISQSQRGLELRKFFAPNLRENQSIAASLNETLNNDGALDAYCEGVIWELGAVHAMISLIDQTDQYFLGGASLKGLSKDHRIIQRDSVWFGCSYVPTHGGLCSHTLALDNESDQYSCFVIQDLSADERFNKLPVVDGTIVAYRFYAGTPITTSNGINIGTIFFFDDQPRAGFSLQEKKTLCQQATNVMRYLETKKDAAEHKRGAVMIRSMATFLDRTAQLADRVSNMPSEAPQPDRANTEIEQTPVPSIVVLDAETDAIISSDNASQADRKLSQATTEESVQDRVRMTLEHAAEILRNVLGLVEGGVLFLDTADKSSHESLEDQDSSDKSKCPAIQAISTTTAVEFDSEAVGIDGKRLSELMERYPKGTMWYINEASDYFASVDQVRELDEAAGNSPSGRKRQISEAEMSTQQDEARLLLNLFPKARQIMFVPLWDAGSKRWYSGCFVFSHFATPVLSDLEISYLVSFTNSIMVEISRLDALATSKIKSDFISSISHELRSPLHAILGAAEFLRQCDLDSSELELVSTVKDCGDTLLDTINHVLDYAKINSFKRKGDRQGTVSSELYGTANIALLCENTIDAMTAAGEYSRSTRSSTSQISAPFIPRRTSSASDTFQAPVKVILDIDRQDYDFQIQAGALRRVIQNLFGNAQKYTKEGFIIVRLGIQKQAASEHESQDSKQEVISLLISDSGKGMSPKFLERNLYQAFSQEDNLSYGVGLGLSIVRSIVDQIGGKIHVNSKEGRGTDVHVTLPLSRGGTEEIPTATDVSTTLVDATIAMRIIRNKVAGKRIRILHSSRGSNHRHQDLIWSCIKRYCSDWYGCHVLPEEDGKRQAADIIITDNYTTAVKDYFSDIQCQHVLVIHEGLLPSVPQKYRNPKEVSVASASCPIGPFKLARCILDLLDQEEHALRSYSIVTRRDITAFGTSNHKAVAEVSSTLENIHSESHNSANILSPVIEAPDVESLGGTPMPNADSSSATTEDKSGQAEEVGFEEAIKRFRGLNLQQPPTPGTIRARHPRKTTSSKTHASSITQASLKPQLDLTALRVLAVDDNLINLQLLIRFLHLRKQDTIVSARDGFEAIAAVRKAVAEGHAFDAIFMDISMPNLNGFDATRIIRELEKESEMCSEEGSWSDKSPKDTSRSIASEQKVKPVEAGKELCETRGGSYIVALTGLASQRDRDKGHGCGFDEYLVKPLAFVKIGDILKRLSLKKARHQEA